MNKKQNVVFMGVGEVGTSIFNIYKNKIYLRPCGINNPLYIKDNLTNTLTNNLVKLLYSKVSKRSLFNNIDNTKGLYINLDIVKDTLYNHLHKELHKVVQQGIIYDNPNTSLYLKKETKKVLNKEVKKEIYKERKEENKQERNQERKQEQPFNLFLLDRNNKDELVDEDNGIYLYNDDITDIYMVHICIPYSESFVEDVTTFLNKHKPKTVVIHSTVPVGTTRQVFNKLNYNPYMAHSPVMGVHPNLIESLYTFKKIVGGIDDESAEIIMSEFLSLGIDTIKFDKSEESELAKMLSTTYYGMCIAYMEKIHDLCEKLDVDFDSVYTKTNQVYNEGYEIMDMNNVIRPVLRYMGKGIGGHCITSNAKLLTQQFKDFDSADFVLSVGKPKKPNKVK